MGAVVFSHCMGQVSSLITPVVGVDDRCQARPRPRKFSLIKELLEFRIFHHGLGPEQPHQRLPLGITGCATPWSGIGR